MGICLFIITGRNEVVAKVMFLPVSVILYMGGSPENPPQTRQTPPPGPRRTPLAGRTPHPPRTKENPPWTRQTPPGPKRTPPAGRTPPGPRRTPQTGRHPPGPRRTPSGKKTAAYGQWAAGTHPTGMHSCYRMGSYPMDYRHFYY